MEIRAFKKHYDLELITASHEGIKLGELVWAPLTGAPVFSFKNMPDSIFTAFLDAELIDKPGFMEFREEVDETPLKEAHFAERAINVDSEYLAELAHPGLGKLKGEFEWESVSKFTFSDLQIREMSPLLRVKIDHFLETMKNNRWQDYDGRIRRVYMITELYYGTIKLVVENYMSNNLEAALKKNRVQFRAGGGGMNMTAYEFSHENIPFAMRIEKVRSFNG